MIYDSGIWKDDLQTEIRAIRDFFDEIDLDTDQEDEEDPSLEERDMIDIAFIKLQKFIIYSSIIVRKLIEADKISDELLAQNFPVYAFKKFDKTKVNLFNGFEIEKLYDLENETKKSISLKNLADTIIHSFHLMPKYKWAKYDDELFDDEYENYNNDGLLGFYFSSDKTKSRELLYISFLSYLNILEEVIKDNIILIGRNSDGDIILKSINGKFPHLS
jgi:hypothetical protein